jgi:hypothetical protein
METVHHDDGADIVFSSMGEFVCRQWLAEDSQHRVMRNPAKCKDHSSRMDFRCQPLFAAQLNLTSGWLVAGWQALHRIRYSNSDGRSVSIDAVLVSKPIVKPPCGLVSNKWQAGSVGPHTARSEAQKQEWRIGLAEGRYRCIVPVGFNR